MEIEHFLYTIFEEINRRRENNPLSFTRTLQQRANSEIINFMFNQQINSTNSISRRYKIVCEKCFTSEFDPNCQEKKDEIFNSFFNGIKYNNIDIYNSDINSIGFQIAPHQSGKIFVYIILAKLYPKERLEPSSLSVLIDVNVEEDSGYINQNEKVNIQTVKSEPHIFNIPERTKSLVINDEKSDDEEVVSNETKKSITVPKISKKHSSTQDLPKIKIADRKGAATPTYFLPNEVRDADSSYLEPLKRASEENDYIVQMREDNLPLKIEAIMNALREHRNLPAFKRDDDAAIVLRDLHKRIIFSSQKADREDFRRKFHKYYNLVNFGYTYNEEYSLEFPYKLVSAFWSNCDLPNSHTEENFDGGEYLIVSVVQLRSFCSGIILIGKGDRTKLPHLDEFHDYSNPQSISNIRINALFYDLDALRTRLGGTHLTKSSKYTELAKELSKDLPKESKKPPFAKIMKNKKVENAIVLKMEAKDTLKQMKNLILNFDDDMKDILLKGKKVGIGFAPVFENKKVVAAVVIFGDQ